MQRTEAFLEPLQEEMNFELVDVEFVKEAGTWYLRVYCDMEGGIGVDDCADISRRISDWLDQEDFISESYILEVSSPGLGRPLKKDKDFLRETGKEVEARLFRAVDTGADSTYEVFAPTLRDASLVNGLNQLLIRFEDLCGLSRGTFSDANVDARTATELKIVKQRSYATVADNQKALEKCLRDVLRAMDVYATLYGLAPAGEWAASFEWDDSILTDVDAQLQQRLLLVNSGIMSKAELRQWYLGESEAQAEAAVAAINAEKQLAEPLLPTVGVDL